MSGDRITEDAIIGRLRRLLLDIARHEDDVAAREAAAVPYYEPCPPSVSGHRAAAAALRAEADRILGTSVGSAAAPA